MMWGKSLDCFLFQCRSRLFVVLFPPASTSANASRLLIISVVPFAFCVAAWLVVPLIYFLKALCRQEKFPLGHECRIGHAVEEGRKNMRDGRTESHPVPLSLFFSPLYPTLLANAAIMWKHLVPSYDINHLPFGMHCHSSLFLHSSSCCCVVTHSSG